MEKLSIQDMHSLEINLSTCLAICSFINLCSGIILCLFSAHLNRLVRFLRDD